MRSKKHQHIKLQILKKLIDSNLPYCGNKSDPDNRWLVGFSILFSKKYRDMLVSYYEKQPDIFDVDVPDDILLSILIGQHDRNINDLCIEWNANKIQLPPENVIFHRCKDIDKEVHFELSKYYS